MCLLVAFTGCDNTPDGDGDTGTYYTVTFDSRGGSAVASQTIREGNPVVRPNTPTKDGYYFTGWFKQDNTEWKFDTDRVNSVTTLYAGWKEESQLPVKPVEPEQPTDEQKILVVYFSATGTTAKVANYIKDHLNADIFEITPSVPYTSADLNYNNSNSRTSQENRDDTCRPEIVGRVDNLEQYDIIFIGYPIWHGKAPKVVYTFLEQYDFAEKTIIPFCTAASSGIGSSATYLQGLTTGATWLSGTRFVSSATQSSVQTWVDGILPQKE